MTGQAATETSECCSSLLEWSPYAPVSEGQALPKTSTARTGWYCSHPVTGSVTLAKVVDTETGKDRGSLAVKELSGAKRQSNAGSEARSPASVDAVDQPGHQLFLEHAPAHFVVGLAERPEFEVRLSALVDTDIAGTGDYEDRLSFRNNPSQQHQLADFGTQPARADC